MATAINVQCLFSSKIEEESKSSIFLKEEEEEQQQHTKGSDPLTAPLCFCGQTERSS